MKCELYDSPLWGIHLTGVARLSSTWGQQPGREEEGKQWGHLLP
jgi:hypothetical protein